MNRNYYKIIGLINTVSLVACKEKDCCLIALFVLFVFVFDERYIEDTNMGNKFSRKKKKAAGAEGPKLVGGGATSELSREQMSKSLSGRLDQAPSSQRDISQKYILGKTLGKGHFAKVRAAVIQSTSEKVAVKIIKVRESNKQKATLRKEIEILEKVGAHPAITAIHDVYLVSNELHIVMELCEGGELFDRLIENGAYSEESARKHMRNVCSALQFLHAKNIIHRDLKPENIMLKTKNDPESSLRIADFGLGRILDEKRQARTVCGTWAYTAPEVTRRRKYDYKADMFSFGVILYVMLCAYHPFDPEVGSSDDVIIQRAQQGEYSFDDEEWKFISPEAKDLIDKLLKVNPVERLSAEECLLHPFLATERSSTPLRSRARSIEHGLQQFVDSCKDRWRSKVEEVATEIHVLNAFKVRH